jgi:hypothetical protein
MGEVQAVYFPDSWAVADMRAWLRKAGHVPHQGAPSCRAHHTVAPTGAGPVWPLRDKSVAQWRPFGAWV